MGIFSLWLFKRHLRLYFNYGDFPHEYEYTLAIYFGKNYIFEAYGEGSFSLKNFFYITAKIKKSRAKFAITILGLNFNLRIGHIHYDEYDSHADKYYYWDYDEEKEISYEYKDESMTEPYIFEKPKKEVYKDFYVSKLLKIYTKDLLNCTYGKNIEIALPCLYYLKICFKKPFDEWDWLGFSFDIDFENKRLVRLAFMIFKHELKIVFNKNSLRRKSNLFSVKAIDRYIKLKGKKANWLDNLDNYAPFDILINNSKPAQLKHLISILDFKSYISHKHFEDYCPAHNFNRCVFNICYDYLIKYNIPIENWEYLDNNTYIHPYAEKKLKNLRQKSITSKRNKYTFKFKSSNYVLHNPERIDSCNGYSIIDYIKTNKNGKTQLKTIIIDANNKYFDVLENIWVSYITKNNQIIGHFQDGETIKAGSVLFDMASNTQISPENMDDIEIIDYGTKNSSEQYLKGRKNGKYGLFDNNGVVLIQAHYLDLSEAGNGLIIAQKSKNKYGMIDLYDNIIIPFEYEDIHTIGTKYFTAKKNGKWGLYDYENQTIIAPQYQDFYFYTDYGMAKDKDKWGIVNIKNKSYTGFIFDDIDVNTGNIDEFPVGYDYTTFKQTTDKSLLLDVNVCINKKWGTYSLINGKRIIPLEYDKIDYFYNGICYTENHNGERIRYIDRKNNDIAGWTKKADEDNWGHYPVEGMYKMSRYDNLVSFASPNSINEHGHIDFEQALHYSEGLVAVSLHGHWGFMDKEQNIVIPLIFDDAKSFHSGKAFVKIGKNWGLIDKNGKEIEIIKNNEEL